MLMQLHHQYKDGHTDFCAQRDVDTISDIEVFAAGTMRHHPLPADAVWMACTKGSKYFVRGMDSDRLAQAVELLKRLMFTVHTAHLDMGGKHRYSLTPASWPVIAEIQSWLYELEG